jgi:ribosomal protein L7/L12
MARSNPLPTAAHLALQDGKPIEAIKLVREAETLDLVAAKRRVDSAVADDVRLQERVTLAQRAARKKLIFWVLVIDAALVAGVLYWFLRPS